MTEVKHKVRSILLEIAIIILFVVSSYFLIHANKMESYTAIIKAYERKDMVAFHLEGNASDEVMIPMTSVEAKQKTPAVLQVKSAGAKTKGTIALKIDKTSTLSYEVLNLIVDGKDIALKNSKLYEDQDSYYIPVFAGEITGELKEIPVYLYMNDEATANSQNKTMEYAFEYIENQVL